MGRVPPPPQSRLRIVARVGRRRVSPETGFPGTRAIHRRVGVKENNAYTSGKLDAESTIKNTFFSRHVLASIHLAEKWLRNLLSDLNPKK